jgi:hypothetical protein
VGEYLPNKHKVLNSNSSTVGKRKEKRMVSCLKAPGSLGEKR